MNITEAIANLKKLEGGYGHEANGEEVMEGIDQSSWDQFAQEQGLAPKQVKDLTPGEIESFYALSYWNPLRCPDLPDPLPFALFQYELNTSGAGDKGRAVKDLQLLLGVVPDGIMGSITVLTAHNYPDRKKLTLLLLGRQEAYYEDLWKKHPEDPIGGWRDRVKDTKVILGL